MESILSGFGLETRFVDAVDGRKAGPAVDAFWNANPGRRLLNAGEIGCMMSHISIWRRIVADDVPCAVVLEDDLCVGPGFGEWTRAIGGLPDLGLLKLDTDRNPVVTHSKPTTAIAGYECYRLLKGGSRTGGYVIWRSAAARLLSTAADFRDSIDIEMFRPRRTRANHPEAHQLVPAICIQAELLPSMTKAMPFLSSTIDSHGARGDARLGLSRSDEAMPVRMMRRSLRPIKQALLNTWCRNFGMRRQTVDFVGRRVRSVTPVRPGQIPAAGSPGPKAPGMAEK